MISQLDCPDNGLLHDLLDGALPDDEQRRLTTHLDTCGRCQRALEGLAGGADPWPGAAPPVRGPRPALESALRDVMDELKSGPDDTRSLSEGEPAPDFIALLERVRPGSRFGAYEVHEVIGQGGMGTVLKASEPALNRFVAIKVLAPQMAASAAARRRFQREACAAAAVCHENVVAIHAVDTSGDLPYLVMQYVPGISLQERLDRSGPLALEETLRIGLQTAAGLAAAHAQGLVHRDVKPANILLENGIERVRLTDFGLARAADDASMTQSGVLAGTPPYMAPEQARGELVDHRADLFSLGSVLYAMCTGRAPFRAPTTLAVLRRVSDDTPRPLREVNPAIPAWLAALIAKLHAKNPQERFQSAEAVADLLARCLAHVQAPDHVPRPPIPGMATGKPPRRLWPFAAAILLGLGLLVGASEAAGFTRLVPYLGTVLRLRTPEGILVIEVDDPEVKVAVDGSDVVISGTGVQEVRLRPGNYKVQGTKPGAKAFEEIVTIARDKKQLVRVTLQPADAQDGGAQAEVPKQAEPPGAAALKLLHSHEGAVTAARFSPDGKVVVTAGEDHKVYISDVETGKMRVAIQGRQGRIVSLSILPNLGDVKNPVSLLAILDEDGTLTLYDVSSGKEVSRLQFNQKLQSSQFSPDGQRVAVVTPETQVLIWDAATGKQVRALEGEAREIYALAFSPDGKVLASGSASPQARLWDLETGKMLRQFGRDGPVHSLAFSPDGRRLATATAEAAVRLWDVETGKEIVILKGSSDDIGVVNFSPDGRLIVTGDADGVICFWDVRTGKQLAALKEQKSRVTVLAFSPDGRTVVAGAADGTVRLWALGDRRQAEASPDEVERLRRELQQERERAQAAEAEARAQLDRARAQEEMARTNEARARLLAREAQLQAEQRLYAQEIALAQRQWDEGNRLATLKALEATPKELRGWEWRYLQGRGMAKLLGHSDRLMGLAFSPDGKRLASAGADKTVRLWDLATRTQVAVPFATADAARAVAFSPDGKLLAAGSLDGTLEVWDAATGKLAIHEKGEKHPAIHAVAFRPDGSQLASAGDEPVVTLYDARTGKLLRKVALTAGAVVNSLAYSPDAKFLAVGTKEHGFYVFDPDTEHVLPKLGNSPDIQGSFVAFSPDGRRLVTAVKKTILIWDVETGKQLAILSELDDVVTGLAFTPDGRRLAASSADNRIRVYDASTWQELLALQGHRDAVTCLAFSPDGEVLASGGLDKTIILWNPPGK